MRMTKELPLNFTTITNNLSWPVHFVWVLAYDMDPILHRHCNYVDAWTWLPWSHVVPNMQPNCVNMLTLTDVLLAVIDQTLSPLQRFPTFCKFFFLILLWGTTDKCVCGWERKRENLCQGNLCQGNLCQISGVIWLKLPLFREGWGRSMASNNFEMNVEEIDVLNHP
jgi:hypothetical protein